MPSGTRICVLGADGFGLGRVISFLARSSGANEHTVQFDRGLTKQLDLKKARWTVKPGDMEQLRAEQEAAEADRAVKRCFLEVTGHGDRIEMLHQVLLKSSKAFRADCRV